MAAKIISISYKDVEVYEGSANKLMKETTFYAYFNRIYFCSILFGLLFSLYALFAYDIFVNPIWDILFVSVLAVAGVILFFAAKKEKTFDKISHLKHCNFVIDKVEVAENGEMYVNAYAMTDTMQSRVFRFKFDETVEFTNKYFTLYQVYQNGYKTLHYCVDRKKVK